MGMTRATVREWHDDEGWGVLDSPETPGGCWAHFSAIEATGFRSLNAGETVRIEWSQAEQDGYAFLAERVIRESASAEGGA